MTTEEHMRKVAEAVEVERNAIYQMLLKEEEIARNKGWREYQRACINMAWRIRARGQQS